MKWDMLPIIKGIILPRWIIGLQLQRMLTLMQCVLLAFFIIMDMEWNVIMLLQRCGIRRVLKREMLMQ